MVRSPWPGARVYDREQLAFVLNDLCRLYTCRGEFEKAYVRQFKKRVNLWRSSGSSGDAGRQFWL